MTETTGMPAGYSYSAPTMLVLFEFLNAVASGAAIIQTRKYGVFARALATPIRPRDLVLGEGLCNLALALIQSVLIVVVGAVMFDVSWGDPAAAVALVVVWALVGNGDRPGGRYRVRDAGWVHVAARDRPTVRAPCRARLSARLGGRCVDEPVVAWVRPG